MNRFETKRVLWADIAKFFAIVTVVGAHLGLPHHLDTIVHMFNMPVFFVLAGMFYSKEKYQKFSPFFLSRIRNLLVPYFAWGVILYGIYRLMPYSTGMTEVVPVRRFIVALFTQDANNVLFVRFGVIQWFFTSLFLSEMAMWVIIRVSNHVNKSYQFYYYVLIAVLLIIINSVVCSYIEPNWLGFKSSILGTLFCLTGFVLKDEIKRILDAENRALLSVSVFALAVFVAVFFLNGYVNVRMTKYNNPLLFILGALSGSLLVFIVSRQLEKYLPDGLLKEYILYIGRNTVIVYCTNRLVQNTFILAINALIFNYIHFNSGFGLYFKYVVDFVVEMLLFVPIIYFVNRWLPFTIGRPMRKQK